MRTAGFSRSNRRAGSTRFPRTRKELDSVDLPNLTDATLVRSRPSAEFPNDALSPVLASRNGKRGEREEQISGGRVEYHVGSSRDSPPRPLPLAKNYSIIHDDSTRHYPRRRKEKSSSSSAATATPAPAVVVLIVKHRRPARNRRNFKAVRRRARFLYFVVPFFIPPSPSPNTFANVARELRGGFLLLAPSALRERNEGPRRRFPGDRRRRRRRRSAQ